MRPRLTIFCDSANFFVGQAQMGVRMRIEEMARQIAERYDAELVKLRYYCAPMPSLAEPHRKAQERFYRALSYVPEVELVLGRHDPRTMDDGRVVHQEKETDVRLAIDMVLGAVRDDYDIAVVVSGDTDFVPAIEAVRQFGKRVVWAHFPHQRGIKRLYMAAGEDLEMTPAFCAKCSIVPPPVRTSDRSSQRPGR